MCWCNHGLSLVPSLDFCEVPSGELYVYRIKMGLVLNNSTANGDLQHACGVSFDIGSIIETFSQNGLEFISEGLGKCLKHLKKTLSGSTKMGRPEDGLLLLICLMLFYVGLWLVLAISRDSCRTYSAQAVLYCCLSTLKSATVEPSETALRLHYHHSIFCRSPNNPPTQDRLEGRWSDTTSISIFLFI